MASLSKDNFFGFSLLKQYIKKSLLSNQKIVNLICNKTDNIANFENVATGSKSPARSFIRQYKYVPETVEEESVFVTMQCAINSTNSFSIKDIDIVIYIFAHVNLMEMAQGIRTDILAGYIDNAINGTDELGIGRLQLIDGEEYNPIEDYYGWALRYSIYDVNRTGKKI
jgi:hypothetical protein